MLVRQGVFKIMHSEILNQLLGVIYCFKKIVILEQRYAEEMFPKGAPDFRLYWGPLPEFVLYQDCGACKVVTEDKLAYGKYSSIVERFYRSPEVPSLSRSSTDPYPSLPEAYTAPVGHTYALEDEKDENWQNERLGAGA